MPNYCECDLYISGKRADVLKVIEHIGATQTPPDFDFNKVIPYPERFVQMDTDMESVGRYTLHKDTAKFEAYKSKWGTDKDGFNSGGYEWSCDNWGTKWNAGEVSIRVAYESKSGWDYIKYVVSFHTAWNPPNPIIHKLAEMFPAVTITIEYFERGMGFAGGYRFDSLEDAEDKENRLTRQWETEEYRGERGG